MPASKRGDPAWLLAVPAIGCSWHAKKHSAGAKLGSSRGWAWGEQSRNDRRPSLASKRRSRGWCWVLHDGNNTPKEPPARRRHWQWGWHRLPHPPSQLSRRSFQLHVTSARDRRGGAGWGPFPPPLHLPTSHLVPKPARSHLNIWDTLLHHRDCPGWPASPARGMAGVAAVQGGAMHAGPQERWAMRPRGLQAPPAP